MICCHLQIFLKIFLKNSFRNTSRVNQFEFGLGPQFGSKLFAKVNSR